MVALKLKPHKAPKFVLFRHGSGIPAVAVAKGVEAYSSKSSATTCASPFSLGGVSPYFSMR
jgi:hypothetical protein